MVRAGCAVCSLSSGVPPAAAVTAVAALVVGGVALKPVTGKNVERALESMVELYWQTEAEIDFSHFIIERSADGYDFEGSGSMRLK